MKGKIGEKTMATILICPNCNRRVADTRNVIENHISIDPITHKTYFEPFEFIFRCCGEQLIDENHFK
jgi:hypothetical protein